MEFHNGFFLSIVRYIFNDKISKKVFSRQFWQTFFRMENRENQNSLEAS